MKKNILLNNQKGGMSPFMFGMLISVTVLSGLAQYWSQEELKRIENQKQNRISEKAEDIKKAIENKILTENTNGKETYQTFFSIDTLKGNLTSSTGKTRSGKDIHIASEKRTGKYGETGSRIRISASDDAFKTQKLEENATDALNLSGTDTTIEVVDTSTIREKQVKQSKEYLEMESSQIFRYYASHNFAFPSESAYKELNTQTHFKDAWGKPFTYRKVNHKKAIIGFTTPWGYRFTKTLSME